MFKFFEQTNLPDEFDLHPHGKITDLKKFVDTHISIIKKQSGNRRYLPYYERLLTVYKKLK